MFLRVTLIKDIFEVVPSDMDDVEHLAFNQHVTSALIEHHWLHFTIHIRISVNNTNTGISPVSVPSAPLFLKCCDKG